MHLFSFTLQFSQFWKSFSLKFHLPRPGTWALDLLALYIIMLANVET